MAMTRQQLQAIVERLYESPPSDEAAFREEKHYLELALDSEERAELCLLAAERESALIAAELEAEAQFDAALSADRLKLAAQRDELARRVAVAARLGSLLADIDEHKLRGNIRYLKHCLQEMNEPVWDQH